MAKKRKKKAAKKKATKTRPRGPKKGAGHSRVVRRPQNWDKAVSAAYLRSIGASQEEAAKSAGLSPETLGGYEHSPWWKDAQAEAHDRWLRGVTQLTKRGILSALQHKDHFAATARWAAERRINEFAPPKQKQEITGAGGGPVAIDIRFVDGDDGEE